MFPCVESEKVPSMKSIGMAAKEKMNWKMIIKIAAKITYPKMG
jgi:hypothetical protein